MNNDDLRRIVNYHWCRERHAIGDELDWMRIEGMSKVKLGRPVVLVTGAFDLLHVGHMRLLFMARDRAGKNGTVLCAMNSDESVQRSKGVGRPILSWSERAAALAYMPIDVLVEFDTEAELKQLVEYTKPDIQICGPEYMNKPTTAGIDVACVRESGIHTSDIIKRISKLINTRKKITPNGSK